MTPQARLQAILDLLHTGSNAKALTDRQAGLILQKLANATALVDIYNNHMVPRGLRAFGPQPLPCAPPPLVVVRPSPQPGGGTGQT